MPSSSRGAGITTARPVMQHRDGADLSVLSPESAIRVTDSTIRYLMGNKISWTSNKKNWEQYVVLDDGTSLESVGRKYATSSQIFVPTNPIVFSPNHMLKNLLSEPGDRNRVIEAIKAKLDSPRAFGIVSPSWLIHIGKERAAERPRNHVGDILLVSENGSAYLWTLVKHANADYDLQMSYLTTAGRLTKWLFLKKQTQSRAFRVDGYLYNLEGNTNTIHEPQLQQYTKSFFVNNIGLKSIQESLTEAIVMQETYLKNVIGQACGYKLSAEQWQIAKNNTSAPVIVVSGPPGSGKTLLCSHFLRKRGSKKEECLYICTTRALGAFMESQNICLVQVVRTDSTLRKIIEGGDYDNITRFAFDDAHMFSCSEATTTKLLKLVKSKPNVRLYVFHDNKFQCFDEIKKQFPDMVKRCCRKLDMPCETSFLKEVHRNTRRIMSFLSAVSFKREIKCLNNWEGDDVEVMGIENPLIDSDDNPLVQHIRLLLECKDPDAKHRHYAAQDIAILIDSNHPIKDASQCRGMLSKYMRDVDVHSASTFPRTGIVVITALLP